MAAGSMTTAPSPASGGSAHQPNAKNAPVEKASATTGMPTTLVPMPDMNKVVSGPIPSDYMGFCQAANASACVYLPANTTFDTYQFPHGLAVAVTEDLFIFDPGVCAADGGSWISDQSVCVFTYPVSELTNFKPGVGLSQKADCSGQGFTYGVDPRGAILIDGHVQDENRFITGSSARTCVIQVWTF
jgi:hypothetical protein